MQTIRDFLIATFGASAARIDGIDDSNIGGAPCNNPRFTCSDGGILNLTCSGDVILAFTPQPGYQGTVYLIRDNTDGSIWEARRSRGENGPHVPKPFAKLRLVYSI